MENWLRAQNFEKDWWGNCLNTYWEETKQIVYAKRMGLKPFMEKGKYPVYDMAGASVLDIGGGPVSMLLKCVNVKGIVIDPCPYPDWTKKRYEDNGIKFLNIPGEVVSASSLPNTQSWVDEVWIYNVLQHVQHPQRIIENARKLSSIIRIFEWIDHPAVEGHPHELKAAFLDAWLGGEGQTEELNESGCYGRAYYGIFKGDHYVEKI